MPRPIVPYKDLPAKSPAPPQPTAPQPSKHYLELKRNQSAAAGAAPARAKRRSESAELPRSPDGYARLHDPAPSPVSSVESSPAAARGIGVARDMGALPRGMELLSGPSRTLCLAIGSLERSPGLLRFVRPLAYFTFFAMIAMLGAVSLAFVWTPGYRYYVATHPLNLTAAELVAREERLGPALPEGCQAFEKNSDRVTDTFATALDVALKTPFEVDALPADPRLPEIARDCPRLPEVRWTRCRPTRRSSGRDRGSSSRRAGGAPRVPEITRDCARVGCCSTSLWWTRCARQEKELGGHGTRHRREHTRQATDTGEGRGVTQGSRGGGVWRPPTPQRG